jgi:hypothetical protein
MWILLAVLSALEFIFICCLAALHEPKEYFDDWTIQKVHDAMEDAGIPIEYRTMAISNMQDKGILFRETKVHHET